MTKAKIIVIGTPTLSTGLMLAGLGESIIATKENFQENLEKIIKDGQYGIIIAQDDMISSLDWRMKKKIDSLAYPVIVPVPGVFGESNKEEDLRSIVKRALGFDIMMKKDD
ncbi:MAG: V-type ATP synthase subunit F [Candidatus ainarchaeum sp.]|nr:V-type ATP synthase subunit F [Candidatus ainarchaeum sp.]